MTKRRREEVRQKNRKKQQQLFLIIGVVVAVVAAIAVGVYLLSQSAPIPDGVAEAYVGMEQGVDPQGFPRLGIADAPIVVVEYASFGCPHCKDLSEDELPDLFEYIAAGHVQVVFKPIKSIANPNGMAERGARAAVCAMEQNRFWEMHDLVFYWQGRGYVVNGSRLDAASEALGMDADQLEECFDNHEADGLINQAESEFLSRSFNSTPRILVNNQEIGAGGIVSAVETQMQQLGLGG